MTAVIILVCHACGEPWKAAGNPAICPACMVANFGIAVERNINIQANNQSKTPIERESLSQDSIGEGGAKMTMEEALKKLITDCASIEDWVKLDALNQWAARIDDSEIEENLKPRYPEIKAFPERYKRLLSELKAELKTIGIEWPGSQLEPSKISAESYIQDEIDKQCGEYFRRDIKRRIKEASSADRKLLYLYAKYCSPLYDKYSLEKTVSSQDLSPDRWKGLYEASFGPILGGNALDILRWFNVCNHSTSSSKKYFWYTYKIPKYAIPIIDNVSDFLEVPELADAESYIKGVVSEGDIPHLVFLELALGHMKPNNYTNTDYTDQVADIKNAFELPYPAMFDKYSKSAVGIIAKSKDILYVSPLNKDKIFGEIIKAKEIMARTLIPLFDKIKEALGRDGDISFQKDNLAAYGGYINLGGRTTLYVLLTPWITPPQHRESKDYLQQLPWVYRNTPCLIITSDVFRPNLMKAIQKEGLKDICLTSLKEGKAAVDVYLFGQKAEPFDNVITVLQSLGYKVTDRTKNLREEWYPLTPEAVIDFTNNKFTIAELEANRNIEFQSGRIKDDRISATIEKYGLLDFAKRIGYPSFTYVEASERKATDTREKESVTEVKPEAQKERVEPIPPVPPRAATSPGFQNNRTACPR